MFHSVSRHGTVSFQAMKLIVSHRETNSFMPGNKKFQGSKQKVPYNGSKGFKYRNRENEMRKRPYQKD